MLTDIQSSISEKLDPRGSSVTVTRQQDIPTRARIYPRVGDKSRVRCSRRIRELQDAPGSSSDPAAIGRKDRVAGRGGESKSRQAGANPGARSPFRDKGRIGRGRVT